jgi:Trk K+ transport system NAD-binding subunit
MLRSRSMVPGTLPDLVRHIPDITIASFTVEPGSPLAGTTLGAFNLRKRYRLLVLAIRRGEETITALSGETRLEAGDIAIIYASPEDIAKGAGLFTHPDRS